ncbi:hypothetical protein DOY81_012305 [Sarcophaga bullata]|nr:hypothetical protein DOY81_012305 [Sarcophaga bullata]
MLALQHNGSGIGGPYTRQPGILVYNELCEMFKMKNSPVALGWESKQMVPMPITIINGLVTKMKEVWLSRRIIVRRQNLGGVSDMDRRNG